MIHSDPEIDKKNPARDCFVEFMSGECRLFGTCYVAQGAGLHPTIILLHGFPGSEKHGDLAHTYLRAGYNVLTFSYRGAWGSEGDFSFSHVLEDVARAIAFLCENEETYQVDRERIILAGHSMGGWAALIVGATHPQVKAVLAFAPFNYGAFAQDVLDNPFVIDYCKAAWDEEVKPLQGTSGAALVDEVLANQEAWDLRQVVVDDVLVISAENDTLAPAMIHNLPHLNTTTIEADHAFLGKRIELAQVMLDWLQTLL